MRRSRPLLREVFDSWLGYGICSVVVLTEVINNDPLFGKLPRDNNLISVKIPSQYTDTLQILPTHHPLVRSVTPVRQQVGFLHQSAPDHLLIYPWTE